MLFSAFWRKPRFYSKWLQNDGASNFVQLFSVPLCIEAVKLTDVVVERGADESLAALCARETGARRRYALLLQCVTMKRYGSV